MQIRNSKTSRNSGSIATVVAIAAALVVILSSALTASPVLANDGQVTAVQSNVNLPAETKRFQANPNPLRFRAYFTNEGARNWDGWVSCPEQDGAVTSASEMLEASSKYSFAFVEDGKTGRIVWRSWDNQ
ncbi:MAG TPA: hypothetical protein VGC54_11200 [Planctomycetota bacterium]